jgi:HEAT repeat protein
MLPKRGKSNRARLSSLILMMAALLAILTVAWHFWQPEMLARRFGEQLSSSPESEVDAQLRQIAELGDAGLPVLAGALGSDRKCVREAARRLLIEQVDRWELLPAATSSAKLSMLAHSLAESVPRFDWVTRKFAADLAMRILHWPHRGDQVERVSLLADCEAILAATAASRGAEEEAAKNPASQSAIVATDNFGVRRSSIDGSTEDLDAFLPLPELIRLPGGGLPIEMASMPAATDLAGSPASEQGSSAGFGEPNRLPARTAGRPIDDSSEPPNLLRRPPGANQPGRLPSEEGDPSDPSKARLLHAQADKEPSDFLLGTDDPAVWKRLEPREVMRRLHATDLRMVAAARAELQRRGMDGSQVELARRVTDPNPEVRRQVAESLPALAGVDAKPWFLELSYDEDPRVRATAVTLMATSGDLELMKRVQQISLDDPDDYTRAQAEKALPRRRRE